MFGTDGVRGTPGRAPLDARTIARLGAAAARVIAPRGATLLAARDTRESGAWIEGHLARGVAHAHGTLLSGGVLPTPAAAFLVSTGGFDGGMVVSASHNPFPDNGIKVLSADGGKASPALEAEIESLVRDRSWDVTASDGAAPESRDLSDAYLAHAAGVLADCLSLPPLRIAADCANGAMSRAAPEVLRRLGFEVVALNVAPDGRNINRGCGLHASGGPAAGGRRPWLSDRAGLRRGRRPRDPGGSPRRGGRRRRDAVHLRALPARTRQAARRRRRGDGNEQRRTGGRPAGGRRGGAPLPGGRPAGTGRDGHARRRAPEASSRDTSSSPSCCRPETGC